MYRITITGSRAAGNTRRILAAGISCLLAAGGFLLPLSASATTPAVTAAASALNKPDPEVLLIEVYKELGANHLRQALAKADKLVEAYPNFRLGHLIRGDLLLMHTRPVTTFGAVDGPQDKLKNLREEAMARLKSLRERPDPDLIPRAILQLLPVRHVIDAIDAWQLTLVQIVCAAAFRLDGDIRVRGIQKPSLGLVDGDEFHPPFAVLLEQASQKLEEEVVILIAEHTV